jgi:hypothetical protein
VAEVMPKASQGKILKARTERILFPMKLAVITANYGPRSDIHWMTKSCEMFKIPLHVWGQAPWCGWLRAHLDAKEELKKLRAEGYTHFLYTDGRDAFFVVGLDEVLAKYTAMGSPRWLVAGEMNPWPLAQLGLHEKFATDSPYKYPNCGGQIGEIDYVLDRWDFMEENYKEENGENTQGYVQRGFVEGVLAGMKIDTECRIFQCWEGALNVDLYRGRVFNQSTFAKPCLIHFHGGYTDPVHGKNDRIAPVWKELFG